MSQDNNPDPGPAPWGPFVNPNFVHEHISKTDVIIASVVWGLTIINVFVALYLIYFQTKGSRSPLRSVYVWMIWLELLASIAMGIQCYLYILKLVGPSFIYFFMVLFFWCIQVQLLLQIIINRIRVIVPDRRKSRRIMVGTAAIVTAINISVYCIWIPARLQVPGNFQKVNAIWDRVEKVIYLLIDAALNWYFLRVVKQNLINNGLQKYNKLLRFNQRIIIISLLMDVMIIAAMSIPNSFVYTQFHPLAYLVKLNIEMTMANLIKRIAITTAKRGHGNASIVNEFASTSGNKSSSGYDSTAPRRSKRRGSVMELSTNISQVKSSFPQDHNESNRIVSFAPHGNQIKKTEEIKIVSEPNPDLANALRVNGVEIRTKSLDDITEGGESVSVKSEEAVRRGDSDDEGPLVIQAKKSGWGRLRD